MSFAPIEPEIRWLGSKKFWLRLCILLAILAALLGGHAAFVLSRHAPPQEAFLYGQAEIIPGIPTPYRVYVRDAMTERPVHNARVRLAVMGPEGDVVLRQTATTTEDGLADLSVGLPDGTPEGQYSLRIETASAHGDSEITRTVDVARSFRVLVTTDKPVYQPGQVICMRALALANADLRPVVDREAILEVHDAKSNKVFKKVARTSEFGIVSAEFQLADQVNTGDYVVSATVGDTASERSVNVQRYALPKFTVEIETDRGYYAPGESVRGRVDAVYTFGKPIAGGSVRLVASEFIETFRPIATVEGTTDAEGTFSFEFPLKEYFAGVDLKKGDALLALKVEVTDAAGHVQRRTDELTISADPIRIEVFPESGALVQGVENVVYVVTAYPDGRPAQTTLTVGKTKERLETSDLGIATVKLTPATPHLQLTVAAEDAFGARAQVTRPLRIDSRVQTVLLRTDRAVYRVGDSIQLTVLSPQASGRVFIDVVKDRRTVLTQGLDVRGGQSVLTIDLPPDLAGTVELHAYRILPDGNIVGDTRVVQVTRPEDLSIAASLDKSVYRPAEEAILELLVRDSAGAPEQVALSLAGVDEAVFALQEMRPGLERMYFLLQEEILEPRYEIHAHPPVTAEQAVREGPPSRPELEEATVVLFSSAEGAAPPDVSASERFEAKQARYRDEQDAYVRSLAGQGLLLPVYMFYACTLPVIGYIAWRCVRRVPLESGAPEERRTLVRTVRHLGWWCGAGFYLPTLMGIAGIWLVEEFRPYLIADVAFVFGLTTVLLVHVVLLAMAWPRPEGARATLSRLVVALASGGAAAGLLWLSLRWEWASLLGMVLGALLVLVGFAHSTWRLRRSPLSWHVPALRKVSSLLPGVYALAIVGVVALVVGASGWPPFLDEEPVVLAACGMLLIGSVLLGGLSACAVSLGKAIGLTRFIWVMCTRSVVLLLPFLAAMLLPALAKARESARRGGPPAEVVESAAPGGDGDVQRFLLADVSTAQVGASLANVADAGTYLKNAPESRTDESAAGRRVLVAPTRVRRYFPETLLWLPEVITDPNGRARVPIRLADSITTWRLAASAVSRGGGLGSTVTGLRVFQDFFVDIDFPATLTQHDQVAVPIAVYNYLDTPQRVRLELEAGEWYALLGEPVREVDIAAQAVTSVRFPLEVRAPGYHTLTVRAYGSTLADAVERRVLVEPDGEPVVQTINGRLETEQAHHVDIPQEAIDGASDLILKIYPGAFSQVVEGLDSIFRMPFGCFEQTSSTTYPNVLVLDYMRRTKQLKPDIELKALNFINVGYQRLLSYEVDGGGFEWFGQSPAHLVLTAYGLMEFTDMAEVADVDPAVIQRTRRWLVTRQQRDGSWQPEEGGISEGAIGRFTGQTLRTTAYVAWALAKSGEIDPPLAAALGYVAQNVGQAKDPYTLAVCANALVAGKRAEARSVLEQLDALKQTEGDQAHWTSQEEGLMYSRGEVLDIETTALAAYAYLRANHRVGTAHQALAWLIQRKDAFGTWYSTQATVHAMRAFLAGAGPSGRVDRPTDVTVTVNDVDLPEVPITPETSDVFRLISLRDHVREGSNRITIAAAGDGGALAYQVVATHYVPWGKEVVAKEAMTIDVEYDTRRLSVDDVLGATATIGYHLPHTAKMVIVDLGIPPGFEVDTDTFAAMKSEGLIERYTLTGRQVTVYLRQLAGGAPLTLRYSLRAKYPVRVKTPVSRVYEYYNPERRAETGPVELVVL